jgi:hypothetical protein
MLRHLHAKLTSVSTTARSLLDIRACQSRLETVVWPADIVVKPQIKKRYTAPRIDILSECKEK